MFDMFVIALLLVWLGAVFVLVGICGYFITLDDDDV